jgi:REP element-mobilizing transposase RayT
VSQRKSIRLPEYDYTDPGAYFITIVTHEREPLFGKIVDGEMWLNELGRIIQEEWIRSRKLRAPWEFNDYVVMPYHFHGIVEIREMDPVVAHSSEGRKALCATTTKNERARPLSSTTFSRFFRGWIQGCMYHTDQYSTKCPWSTPLATQLLRTCYSG